MLKQQPLTIDIPLNQYLYHKKGGHLGSKIVKL